MMTIKIVTLNANLGKKSKEINNVNDKLLIIYIYLDGKPLNPIVQ